MTTVDGQLPSQAQEPSASEASAPGLLARLDSWLERAVDHVNPILVKEARQALKSRQFVVTYSLLLAFAWGWSLLGIALLMPGVYYSSGGRFMLVGYFLVLAIPLLIVIPFSAFRSLASEREDGTFDLLSITDLSSRQIVTGKMGSAVLQMLVYYSALSPCIGFTYLLRGIDIITVFLVLGWTLLASVMMATVGLLAATIARAKHWQVLVSVVLLLGLAFFAFIWTYFILAFVAMTPPLDDISFWISVFAVICFYAVFIGLGVFGAAGQIGFTSSNRSTRMRLLMLLHHFLWIGWMTYAWVVTMQEGALWFLTFAGGIYWIVMGALMIGESGWIAPRVRRGLPVSYLGRMVLTWLNPGPGTGYVFAVLNAATLAVVVILLGIVAQYNAFRGAPFDSGLAAGAILGVAYLAAYLGVARLITLAMRALGVQGGMILPFVTTCLLLVLGALLPYFVQFWLEGFHEPPYSLLQAPNWAWTLNEVADAGSLPGSTSGLGFSLQSGFVLVCVFALVIFFVNLVFAYREVEQVRVDVPDRVLEDEQQLHPPKVIEAPRTSPWDEG